MKGKTQLFRKLGSSAVAFVLVMMLVVLAECFSIVSLAASQAKALKNANIRKEPDAKSDIVGSAAQNAKVEVLSQTTGKDGKVWYKVTVDANSTGYIRSDLLEITDGSTPPAQDAESGSQGAAVSSTEAEPLVEVSATVNSNVRVRTSPSTSNSNNILTTINGGSVVTIVSRITGSDGKIWYQVKISADNNAVMGYIRSDYLTPDGEIKPLSEETAQQPDETPAEETKPEETPAEETKPEEHQRYETKLIKDKWYILDYQEGQQFDVEKLFSAADEYKAMYEKAVAKEKSIKVWLIIVGLIAVVVVIFAAYLLYRLKDYKEEAFIASIENNTLNGRSRTVDRPRNRDAMPSVGRDKPVINDNAVPRREAQADDRKAPQGQQGRPAGKPVQQGRPDGARPAQQGARPENGRQVKGGQQGRPDGAKPAQQGARPENARPAQQGRPDGARPAQQGRPDGARPAQQGRPDGARPAQQGRPDNRQQMQAQRNAAPQVDDKTVEMGVDLQEEYNNAPREGHKPVSVQPQNNARPAQALDRQDGSKKAKNFLEENDNFEFEFLNWDSDDE